MVADIRLLQGKIIDDLELYPKNFTQLMEELALEILEDQAVNPVISASVSEQPGQENA
jgi:hypothetical protein